MAIGQPQNEKLVQFAAKVKNAAAGNLRSLVLYGSSARDDFQPQFSDLNILLILDTADAAALKTLNPVVRWWREQGEPAPVVMTAAELRQAADVFAIELLDMKQSHRVLEGEDVLSTLDVPRGMHRVQVERELRTAIVKLRQGFLEGKDDASVSRLMTASVSTFATLFRHALMIFGEQPPREKRAAIESTGRFLSAEVSAMLQVLDMREKRAPTADCSELFAAYVEAALRVTDEVDRRLG